MAVQIQLRNDTAANWTSANPTLAAGEVGVETDTDQMKLGDGSTAWNSLGYFEPSSLKTGTAGYTALSNGTAGLSYQPVSHNYIINGAFDIWQRGDGPLSVTGAEKYTSDRWQASATGGNATVDVEKKTFTSGELEVAAVGGAKYFFSQTVTNLSTSTWQQAMNVIEDVNTLAGQTVTLSFWAKVTGETAALVYLSQHFGDGGSATVFHPQNATFTTSWQRYEFTFNLSSVSGKTIGPNSHLKAVVRQTISANGDTLDLWGVQLEAGSIATPFKRNANSIQGELAACQRYYWRAELEAYQTVGVGIDGVNTDISGIHIVYPVEMRVAPYDYDFTNLDLTDRRAFDRSVSAITLSAVGKTSAYVQATGSSMPNDGRSVFLVGDGSTGGSFGLVAEL